MKIKKSLSEAKVIDLFCGIGGMTHGFVREGFDVVAGIDIDKSCKYAYEKNNGTLFIDKDIVDVTPKDILKLFGKAKVKILIGCAPCQPFSRLNLNRVSYAQSNERWNALEKFIELIKAVKPEIVSMENVKDLEDGKKYPIFERFVNALIQEKYKVSYRVVNASFYGVPQTRKRLVLLASKLGKIELIRETHSKENFVTVRDMISHLPPIKAGEGNDADPLHRSSRLSPLNQERIKATPKDGGNAKSWEDRLVLKCHSKKSGKSYMSSVYGRMRWDTPSPTITTKCMSLGTGRYGHPSQNRAISLREAALIQSFPENYKFVKETEPIIMTRIAKHIGNAVPVKLGEVIAKSIKTHLENLKLLQKI
jgi:DNA (cytosine-5)-methyltransferase 1